MFGILIFPSLILVCGILIIPDSPRWLASTNKKNESIKILKKLRYSNFEVNKDFRRSGILGIILQIIQVFFS